MSCSNVVHQRVLRSLVEYRDSLTERFVRPFEQQQKNNEQTRQFALHFSLDVSFIAEQTIQIGFPEKLSGFGSIDDAVQSSFNR